MERAKLIGDLSAMFVGAQAMIKVYRMVRGVIVRPIQQTVRAEVDRHMESSKPPRGVTIMNGEYRDLMAAIKRIDDRGDRHAKAQEHLSNRIATIEDRLST